MKRKSRSRNLGHPLRSLLCAGVFCAAVPMQSSPVSASDRSGTMERNAGPTWLDSLKDTALTGRVSVIIVTSGALETSLSWADHVRQDFAARFGDVINVAEMRAESDPQRVRALNVRSIPTLLIYRSDGKGGLTLAGYREGIVSDEDLAGFAESHAAPAFQALTDQAASAGLRRVVRVQRASVTASAANPQQQPTESQAIISPPQDGQIAAATHQYAQSTAQSSPQAYVVEPPSKQIPPAPVKAPPQQTPPPTTYQAPPQRPTQPVYAAPPPQTAQPVYAYVPQQPVYSAPPSAAPVMVQPPAGQVVVQPAPLNVTVAPSPPPQVTYMTPSMASAPTMAPAPAMVPAPNAFAAAPPFQPAMAPAMAPAPPAEPTMGMPQPSFGTSPGMGFGPAPAAGLGSMAMGMMLTNPNILDRILGGFGRLLAERSYPRIRMNPESPSLFSAPAGMGGFVGINPAMAMAPSQANPVQAYMAVPNSGGGSGDATEAYLKAYIALCKEKGVTPNLPGWEPPMPPPPSGPVPTPQDVQHRKKSWWFR